MTPKNLINYTFFNDMWFRDQAWDWLLPIKTKIWLLSGAVVILLGGFGGMLPQEFFLIGTLCCNLGELKYIYIVLEKIIIWLF